MTVISVEDLGAWYLCVRCGKPTGRPGKTQYCGPCGLAQARETRRRSNEAMAKENGLGKYRVIQPWHQMPDLLRKEVSAP